MTSNVTWTKGQVVHRPAAFLVGEKLNGVIVHAHIKSPLLAFLDVRWPDGTITVELAEDIAPGAAPTPPVTLASRLKALMKSLTHRCEPGQSCC